VRDFLRANAEVEKGDRQRESMVISRLLRAIGLLETNLSF
jgi:hypothetical protein